MRRSITVAALALTAALAYGIYELKYEVARLESELAGLNRDLAAERDAVRVLKAEWSYLNRPRRLERLATEYLELGPSEVVGLGALDELPLRTDQGDAVVAAAAGPPRPVPKPPFLAAVARATLVAGTRAGE